MEDKLKERLSGMFKKKETLIGIFLLGLLLLVIAIPTKDSDEGADVTKNGETDATSLQVSDEDYCSELERRLEDILACIAGVGKVEVMITLKDTGESVVEKDVIKEDTKEGEQSDSTYSEETVYGEEESGTYPYVVNTYRPQIQGVLVVAQGADNSVIKQEIMEGVMALFEVESHKINIINME